MARATTGAIGSGVVFGPMVSSPYDYVSLSYTTGNLTGVIYKIGGSSGITVATLTLAYSGNSLISATKT